MADHYSEWNLLLLTEYFSPAVSGEEVWIQANREELDAFGFHLGGTGGLIDAVRNGAPSINQNNLDVAAQGDLLVRQRRVPSLREPDYPDPGEIIESYSDANAPPYLPTIALLVLAATEYSTPPGFYATVSDLIGVEIKNNSVKQVMKFLFDDLQTWSVNQTKGKFGVFHSRPLGGYAFVGLAKSQGLVAGKDRIGINRLFKQVGLAPRQKLRLEIFDSLVDTAANSHFLSKGLRGAFKEIGVYGPVLKEMLESRLSEWDGRLPSERNQRNDRRNIYYTNENSKEVEDELSLVLKLAFDVGWNIGWRLQSTIEAASYAIEINNVRYVGYPNETHSYVTFVDSEVESQIAARSLLVESVESDVPACLVYSRFGDENGEGKRSSSFAAKDVRVLTWDSTSGSELVERELPIAGTAFLLISDHANRDYLDNEKIDFQQVEEISGLPKDWELLSISSIEDISADQRRAIQSLTGQPEEILVRARIKFVGGCPIIRGGMKQYADYDLPMIELDAPVGAKIKAAGLELNEITARETPNSVASSNIRRFKIQWESGDRHQFEIVVSRGQETLAKSKLKVAISSGAAIGLDKIFSIGRFGESKRENSGVRGLVIGNVFGPPIDISRSEYFLSESFGIKLQAREERFKNNIACLFLDMVAQRGTIEFGAARKLITRLAENAQDVQAHPTFLMLELRSRGHIEIETDLKGHLLRVHKTPPSLFSLPIVSSSSSQWYGVCGSLRLEHWRQLYDQTHIEGYCEMRSMGRAPVLRLAVSDLSALDKFVAETGFELVSLPACSIANWAATIDDTKARLKLHKGYENFRVSNLERLNPQSICFSYETASFMKVDKERRFELFRIDDPVIQGSQVYMLGSATIDGIDFNYIQDSRWAIWLASTAFFEMMSSMGVPDAHPWPLPYSEKDGSLWFPARLKPPLIIERALCLCSGGYPQQIIARADGNKSENFIQLVDANNGVQVIGRLSYMYTPMANGTWLRYQWVPRSIAEKLAVNLGCRLEKT